VRPSLKKINPYTSTWKLRSSGRLDEDTIANKMSNARMRKVPTAKVKKMNQMTLRISSWWKWC